jgi:hypothetical protein
MGRSLALNKAGQHVSLWHARLTAAIERWKKGEPEREQLRRIVSEGKFPPLMAPPAPITGGDQESLEYAHVDQIDMNLFLRYVNKLKAHAGDEMPKITVPRGLGREKIARMEDSLLQRVMAEAGANECLIDAVGHYCTDGNCATWVFMPFLPTMEELLGASKSIEQIIQEAQQGIAEPVRGQDHKAIARALMDAAMKDPDDAAVDRATHDPSHGPQTDHLIMQAAIRYAKAADEAEAEGGYWRHPLGKVVVETQPLGEFGTLFDPMSPTLKTSRWAARRITMTGKEARNYKRFHPKARKHLKPEPVKTKDGEEGGAVRILLGDNEQMDEENGFVVIWEIWDRENDAVYYVNLDVNLYLQMDEVYPYRDPRGGSIIKPIGTHPGWFPVVAEPVMKPTRLSADQMDGIPLLMPGKPQQLEIIKLISAMSGAIKRASAGVYLYRGIDQELVKPIAQAIDGTMVDCDEVDPEINLKDIVASVEWKAPSHELYRQIDSEIARFAISMNFPLSEITSQPMADTATQEEIGLAAGSLGITEILRRLEVNYATQVWIAQSFVANYYTDGAVAQVGGPDAVQVRQAWATQGRLPELPAVKLAAKVKEANPVRVRQLMELYGVASQVVDPATGFPKYDVEHLLLEAAETLGVGTLPPMEITPEMIQMRMMEQTQAEAGGPSGDGSVPSPKTPSGEKSEGPDTGDQKKPQPRGSQENSAARRTDT